MSERRFRFGYVLAPKKVSSFIQDSLVNHAQQQGIDLIPIDLNKPLIEQGPFDCIFHKLYGPEWRKQLEEFSLQNPTSIIIDPIDAIEKLHNRISMLEVVNELKITQENETIGVPLQIFIQENSDSPLDHITRQGLDFPIIAKPLIANGTADSHQMYLVLKPEGLEELKPPIVLQEFVNHGGVIFKVYVAGEHVKCVKRRSLPDISEEKLGTLENLIAFSQISNLTAQDQNDDSFAEVIENAEMPPLGFVTDVANQLRDAMKLHLFNFDMIRDTRAGNRYLVIDINYFPGYAKMPSYETILTAFFLDIARQKQSNESG
ncbi:PREDICTED: inositol-tetrakisphosphate 1-kinase 1-like [Nicotiana attenuata]|uniref:Inositol-tetrakisphosphate 1-kinase n=1 Tax=Nicotiana attenuata TaxID=49451 RepID=A0A1J6KHG8_NICAT|nr:PREDICTED: inositol-tetrakisphosphate 1-kinase 1-like [Nicotiana attenuata]OIT28116.1 inositol-tetrakisphosphate 1-kinase 1 [Nicotiana attenuata]